MPPDIREASFLLATPLAGRRESRKLGDCVKPLAGASNGEMLLLPVPERIERRLDSLSMYL